MISTIPLAVTKMSVIKSLVLLSRGGAPVVRTIQLYTQFTRKKKNLVVFYSVTFPKLSIKFGTGL
jgi:hypothetical protein